jgi:sialidase-1
MRTVLILSVCLAVPGAANPLFEQVDLFRQGDGFSHTYRIPAMAVTNRGVIVAVVDARRDSWRDLPGNIDLVMRRSKDLGKTWEPARVIQDFPEGHGAGDPSLLLDRRTGRLFCLYTYSPPGIGNRNARPGTNDTTDPNTVHAHLIYSDDDGESWTTSQPVDLNPQIKNASWASAMATSGRGLQTRSGRLLQIYFVRPGSGPPGFAAAAFSDDGGRTWQPGGTAGSGTGESKAFERTNGDIVVNMRAGAGFRQIAVSSDGGRTFGPARPDYGLPDPGCNADVLPVSPKVVLYSGLGVLNTRVRMTVRASYDDGRTWRVSRVVHPGPAGYSTMVLLPDGTVGLFYERGNNDLNRDMGTRETLTFARFNLEWLTERIPVLTPAGEPNPAFSSMWAWFDAGKISGQDGEPVTRWNDLAPASIRNLPQASPSAPALRLSAANGKPAVRFAPGQWLAGSTSAWNEFRNLPNGFTLLMVASLDKSSDEPAFLFDHMEGAPGIGLSLSTIKGKPWWTLHATRPGPELAIDQSLPTATADIGALQLHTVTLQGSKLEHALNGRAGVSLVVKDEGVPLYQGSLRLNGDASGARGATSEVAEILVYAGVLDAASLQTVQHALLRKYRITR